MKLLERVLDAHGGFKTWNQFENVQATIVTGGQLFAMKNEPQDPAPRQMTVATKREWASVTPFGSPHRKTDFTAERIAIENLDGTVIEERTNPANHAEGMAVNAPWDLLDRAYFNGYALWTYLTTPFLFTLPGFTAIEIEPWIENGQPWDGLRVTFPDHVASHSKEQDFYFGPDHLLRRHDYHVNASGGFAAAQYVSDLISFQGIIFPIKRRAYMRDEHMRPISDKLMVSIDLSNIRLT